MSYGVPEVLRPIAVSSSPKKPRPVDLLKSYRSSKDFVVPLNDHVHDLPHCTDKAPCNLSVILPYTGQSSPEVVYDCRVSI